MSRSSLSLALIPVLFVLAVSIILGGYITPNPYPASTARATESKPPEEKNSHCSQYADKALQQIYQRIEQTGSVPENDPEWSNDWNHHYRYCHEMPESISKYREDQRQNWLDSHPASRSRISKNLFCRQYAKKTLVQIRERKERTGSVPANDPVWKDDFDHHYKWCLAVPESSVKRGWDMRQDCINRHLGAKFSK